MNRIATVLLVLGSLLGTALTAHAQGVTTASMRGTVIDTAGDPLPGANVLAVHLPTGTQYGTATDVNGTFNLRNMRVGGPYEVRATFIGFQPYVRQDLNLSLGEVEVLTIELSEAAAELDEVEVVARGGIFDSERNGVSTSLDEERIQVTPNIGRDIADYARLTPQAYVENDDDDGPAISIAGQNNRYNSIYIDGTVNNDVFGLSAQGTNGGQTGSTPISIDAIEEFQINLSPFDVTQSGFTGGAINAVTRSGSNRFTGSLYSLLRNESLVGETNGVLADFENEDPVPLPDFRSNRYGFRLGGPIVQNKLFFFVNGEILRSETPLPFNVSYGGDSADRLGVFRQTLQDELGYDPGGFGDKASSLDDNKLLVKLDWNINANNRLSIRHSYSDSDNIDAFQSGARTVNFDNNSEVFPNTTNSTAVELNSTFGNDFANKLIVGYTTVDDDRGFAGPAFPNVVVEDGNGSIFIGSEPFSTANILEQDIFTVTNNFNWFVGRHTLTFGTNIEYYDIANLFIPRNFGTYEYANADDFLQSVCAAGAGTSAYCQENFPGGATFAQPDVFQRGFSLVDDVAGDATNAIGAFEAFQVGFYVQDEFQYSDRLRLTLGLRVDVPKVTTDPRFAPDVFETTIQALETGQLVTENEEGELVLEDVPGFAGADLNGAAPGETPQALPYFSPRFGFNYDVYGNRTLQLRGGVGIFTGRVPFVWPGGMFLNNGTNTGFIFEGSGELANGEPIPFRPDPQNALDGSDFGRDPSELIPSGRLEIFEDDFRYPQVLRTSLGADAQLPGGIIGSIEGQFTKTLSNVVVRNVNLNPALITTSTGPGARPIYADGDVLLDDRYEAVHVVGNTSEGYTYDITASLSKNLNDILGEGSDVGFNLSYTYGDAFAVNDGTSSQLNTLWRSMEVADNLPNDLELTRSDFSLGQRILGTVTVQKEFLGNLATTLALYYTGESGRPFNYTIDNFDDFLGAPGYRDFGLMYVPQNASELTWSGDAAAQAAALETFIASSDYLSDQRGQFAERNGSRLPFEHIFDLKFSQELFANVAGRRQTLEFTLDIFNLGNLLNPDWGLRYDKFTSSSNGGFELLEFQGFVDADAGDYTPVYELEFDPSETPTEEEFFKSQIKDQGTYSSRWFMQIGFRYTF